MRLRAFQLNEPIPELREPHAFALLRPWVDVGSVGTVVLSWIENHLQAKDLGGLARPGDFFDFTRYRPISTVREGNRRISTPNTFISYAKRESGNDFLFLHLLEPHSHSEVYVESVLQLLARFGVKRYCIVGSMHDFVPHTKPLIVTGEASGEKTRQELTKIGIESIEYQGPSSVIFLISQRAPEMGIETMSLIAHLPQYTQMEEDFTGAVRIMDILTILYGIPVDQAYIDKSKQQLEQINIALDNNPQLKAIVQQLESHYNSRTEKKKEQETPRLSPEVERFLAEMDKRFREG
jgi:predicted ATP-grasp superfamily ATP-dependent carboligase